MHHALWALFCLAHTAIAQLTPSNPIFTAPDASNGLVGTNGTSPNTQCCNLLGNALLYYNAQRAGTLSSLEKERVSWRNDSTPNDGQDQGVCFAFLLLPMLTRAQVNLSGGFFDAGNYIKATYPLTFVLNSLSWAALDFGRAFDLCDQAAYLDSTLRTGLDWL
jgi:endoglucanase